MGSQTAEFPSRAQPRTWLSKALREKKKLAKLPDTTDSSSGIAQRIGATALQADRLRFKSPESHAFQVPSLSTEHCPSLAVRPLDSVPSTACDLGQATAKSDGNYTKGCKFQQASKTHRQSCVSAPGRDCCNLGEQHHSLK